MLKRLGRLGIVAVLVSVPLLSGVWQILFNSEVGMAKDIGIQGTSLSEIDYASVPQTVINDAARIAAELFSNSQRKLQNFTDQLLSTYVEARNSDVVVFFNPGGWGWNMTENSPGWGSILNGIQAQLENQGYRPLMLNYRRTGSGIFGCLREFFEVARRYPNKAKDLAWRVEFLTDNLPGLKVILAGESTGTVITDKTMGILKNIPRIYSIQTGTPFWHKPVTQDRTLLMNSNGAGIDTFSYGNIPAMIWATIKGWMRLSSPDENPGNILSWLRAPGHDYSWQYPGVSSEVTSFLQSNFAKKD